MCLILLGVSAISTMVSSSLLQLFHFDDPAVANFQGVQGSHIHTHPHIPGRAHSYPALFGHAMFNRSNFTANQVFAFFTLFECGRNFARERIIIHKIILMMIQFLQC
jgi:hypothetical protein